MVNSYGNIAKFIFVITQNTPGREERNTTGESISTSPFNRFRLVFRFTRTISYIRVSDLMLEMLMLVFFIMFFMAFAQVNSRVDPNKKEWKIAAYGLCMKIWS